MEIESLLRESHLCKELDEEELARVRSIVVRRSLKKNETLFFEGDTAEGFYLLLAGKVRIFKSSIEGKEYTLHLIHPGQLFAEAAIFGSQIFPANCCALDDSLLGFFPKERFMRLLEKSPRISLKMIAGLAAFVREFNQMVEELSLKEVSARLATYLMRERHKQPGDSLTLPVSKSELARRLGTVSETLSRNFKKLSACGSIEVSGKNIRILDAPLLERIAEGEKP